MVVSWSKKKKNVKSPDGSSVQVDMSHKTIIKKGREWALFGGTISTFHLKCKIKLNEWTVKSHAIYYNTEGNHSKRYKNYSQ